MILDICNWDNFVPVPLLHIVMSLFSYEWRLQFAKVILVPLQNKEHYGTRGHSCDVRNA